MRAEQVVTHAWELFQAGQLEPATRVLRQFLQRAPGEPNANKLMAMIHGAQHQDEQALFFITRAAAASPKDPDLHFMHGNVLFLLRRMELAVPVLRRCLHLKPDHAKALDVLSKCLLTVGRGDEAVSEYARAIERSPGSGGLYRDLAATLCEIGRADDAAGVLKRGMTAVPGDRDLAMTAACYLNFVDFDPLEHRDLHVRVAAPLSPASPVPRVPPAPCDRPLRVALLSSDFRDHACGTFLRPLVQYWPSDLATLYLYSAGKSSDAWTGWFQSKANWREVATLDGDALRRQAGEDAIDVVVDCNGWTDGHRLDALALRIAPLQGTLLGYPNTTGLPAIDVRLIDAVTDPPGSESHCTERPARIEQCFLCYMPQDGDPDPGLSDALSPGRESGPITFGSFNRLAKISNHTIRLWAAVLRRVPNSRMLLKGRVQSEPLNREFAVRFASHGVDPARIAFSPYAAAHHDHLALYREIDIALDCTPYNGTTTTCEALWMGVPVLTLAGDVHRARVGASLLTAAGLPELIAHSEAEFESTAAGLAENRAVLRELHAGLRERVCRSALFDAPGYAQRFVKALVAAWGADARP